MRYIFWDNISVWCLLGWMVSLSLLEYLHSYDIKRLTSRIDDLEQQSIAKGDSDETGRIN